MIYQLDAIEYLFVFFQLKLVNHFIFQTKMQGKTTQTQQCVSNRCLSCNKHLLDIHCCVADSNYSTLKSLRKNLEAVPGKHSIDSLQKTAILGTSHIIRKVLQCEA